jgi:hypothetical protein
MSWTVEDFCAWVIGRNPDLKIIFASYADSLGVRINNDLQRLILTPRYQQLFPYTAIGLPGWVANSDMFEIVGRRGSFRNVTVQGGINGHELHLGLIDDPIKGRAEANSLQIREKTWNWFADDFFARFAADAGMLIVATRASVRYVDKAGTEDACQRERVRGGLGVVLAHDARALGQDFLLSDPLEQRRIVPDDPLALCPRHPLLPALLLRVYRHVFAVLSEPALGISTMSTAIAMVIELNPAAASYLGLAHFVVLPFHRNTRPQR